MEGVCRTRPTFAIRSLYITLRIPCVLSFGRGGVGPFLYPYVEEHVEQYPYKLLTQSGADHFCDYLRNILRKCLLLYAKQGNYHEHNTGNIQIVIFLDIFSVVAACQINCQKSIDGE